MEKSKNAFLNRIGIESAPQLLAAAAIAHPGALKEDTLFGPMATTAGVLFMVQVKSGLLVMALLALAGCQGAFAEESPVAGSVEAGGKRRQAITGASGRRRTIPSRLGIA